MNMSFNNERCSV